MIPDPRYMSTTLSAMPAISAPEPSPSRTNSRICSTVSLDCRLDYDWLPAGLRRRLQPAGHLHEVGMTAAHAGELEELRTVVADPWRGRVLAALELGSAERLRPGERLRLGLDGRRGQVGVADLVEDLHGRQHLPEVDDVPRVRLVGRGGVLLRHRLIRR